MAQPFNYQQQVANPFEQAIGGAMKGLQFGTAVRQLQEQRQAAILAKEQQDALMTKLTRLSQNPNPTFQDYEEVATFLPKDAAEGLRKNYELRTKEQQESAKKFSGQVVAALSSGNETSRKQGINLLRQRAEAEKNAGNSQEAQAYELHAKIAETSPEAAKAIVDEIMIMGTSTFGKDWAEGILKVRAAPEEGFRMLTAIEVRDAGLPPGSYQRGPKGEIKPVGREPLVKVDLGQQRDTLALKELDVPRAKEFSDAASSARKLANDSRIISNLLKGAGGGRLIKLTTELQRDFGFDSDRVSANDLANALATRGAVQIRAPGSGATSDLEFKSYLQAFPSLANSERGRELMAKYAEAFAKRSARLADHARKLIREDKYSEEEIARFDESLGSILGEDFYAIAQPGRRQGVPQYRPQGAAPTTAPAPVPGMRTTDDILRELGVVR